VTEAWRTNSDYVLTVESEVFWRLGTPRK